jgi:dihydrodipicolinate reductase
MIEDILVVGHGKFAQAIVERLPILEGDESNHKIRATRWEDRDNTEIELENSAVVHVGSGRQLTEVFKFCNTHGVPLLQGSTDVKDVKDPEHVGFVYVEAPNLSIPVVKFLFILRKTGYLFKGRDVRILESHQSSKKNVAGTAQEMANSLGAPTDTIVSVRDPHLQGCLLGVPDSYLSGHAIHIIEIIGDETKLSFKTEVFGRETYLFGILRVLYALPKLTEGKYFITDLVERGLI